MPEDESMDQAQDQQAADPTIAPNDGGEDAKPEQGSEDKPKWSEVVPENLRRETPEETIEALAKSYTELRKKLSSGEHKKQGEDPTIKPDGDADTVLDHEKMLVKAGLDPDDVRKTIENDGQLSEEQIQKIARANRLDESVVRDYIEGQRARAMHMAQKFQRLESVAAEVAGGQDSFENLKAWAAANMESDSEVADVVNLYNKVVQDPNAGESSIRLAVEGLVRVHKQKTGSSTGSPVSSGSLPGNRSALPSDPNKRRELFTEALRTGKMPVDVKALAEEARRRGIS